MALETKQNIDELIEIFINNSKFLASYESTDRIINNEEHSYNKAKKIASQKYKAIKALLKSEEGITELIKLLNHNDIVISSATAEILYPLFPIHCIKILKNYSKSLSNKLDAYKVDCMIEGLNQKQDFFINNFKKLYNTDNLEELNRESKEKCK